MLKFVYQWWLAHNVARIVIPAVVVAIGWVLFHLKLRRPRCPHCWRIEDVAPARLKWWDILLLPLLLWPFRCGCCNLRFYVWFWLER
jgi:hypothetical protein